MTRCVLPAVCLLTVGTLVSCQNNEVKSYNQIVLNGDTPVCEIITHHNRYIGKTVQLKAKWETDNVHYGFFKDVDMPRDARCQGEGRDLIQLGYIYRMHDHSVLKFFNVGKELCKLKGQPTVCVQHASIEFIGTVMDDKDGLYFHLDKILSYKYYPNSRSE